MNFFASTARTPAQRREMMNKPIPPVPFGPDYYDNPKFRGYGGYHYDGRYKGPAREIVAHYGLKPGDSVLEIGCAKGYLLRELESLGMTVRGIEISEYARSQAIVPVDEWRGPALPYNDDQFDLVICKEVLPHMTASQALITLVEMQRLAWYGFVEIQTASTPESAQAMREWDPSHKLCWPPRMWLSKMREAGYTGDRHFKELF